MTINHVLILISEPKSIFLEILFKYFNSSKHRLVNKKITLVGNLNLIQNEAKTLNFKKIYESSKFKRCKKKSNKCN